jgi:hypothetical protein
VQGEPDDHRENDTMRKFWLGLAVAVAAAAPAAAQDAAAVVKRAIDAHGGADALNKTRTARAKGKGTLTLLGQDHEFASASVYALPDKFKLELAAEINKLKLTATQVVNGKQVKVRTTLAGTEQPATDRVKEEALQAVLVQDATTLTPLVEGNKYTLKLEKDEDVEGSPAAVVLVTGNGLKELRLYFDRKTGRLVKTKRTGLASNATGVVEVTEESFLSDFKPVGAAQIPMKVLVKHDGKPFMTVTVTEVTPLDKVDPDEFKIEK